MVRTYICFVFKFIGISALAYLAVNQIGQYIKQMYPIRFLGVDGGDIKIIQSTINFRLELSNKSRSDMVLRQVTGLVSQGGRLLGSVNARSEITVKAGQTRQFILPLRIDNAQVFERLADILQGSSLMIPFRFDGSTLVNDQNYPINTDIAILR